MQQSKRPVVLITGSAKRTGLIMAEEFAKRGYDIALHHRSSPAEAVRACAALATRGARAIAYESNLTQHHAVEQLVAAVFADFGTLDVLVNNASVFIQDKLADFDIRDLDDAWNVNCRAPLLLTRAFYDRAKSAGTTGVVVNVIDQKVKDNFHPDHFSYTVAKTALGNLTDMLAVSCIPVLRVNAVYPGLMLPSDDQTQADFEHAAKLSSPLGFAASPADMAAAIIELTQARYNGAEIVVDAGQNLIRVEQDVIYKYRAE